VQWLLLLLGLSVTLLPAWPTCLLVSGVLDWFARSVTRWWSTSYEQLHALFCLPAWICFGWKVEVCVCGVPMTSRGVGAVQGAGQ